MPQARNKIHDYRAALTRPPGMKDSLRKFDGKGQKGNKIKQYCVSSHMAQIENKEIK